MFRHIGTEHGITKAMQGWRQITFCCNYICSIFIMSKCINFLPPLRTIDLCTAVINLVFTGHVIKTKEAVFQLN